MTHPVLELCEAQVPLLELASALLAWNEDLVDLKLAALVRKVKRRIPACLGVVVHPQAHSDQAQSRIRDSGSGQEQPVQHLLPGRLRDDVTTSLVNVTIGEHARPDSPAVHGLVAGRSIDDEHCRARGIHDRIRNGRSGSVAALPKTCTLGTRREQGTECDHQQRARRPGHRPGATFHPSHRSDDDVGTEAPEVAGRARARRRRRPASWKAVTAAAITMKSATNGRMRFSSSWYSAP